VAEDGSSNRCLTEQVSFKATFERFQWWEKFYFEGSTVPRFRCKVTKESLAKFNGNSTLLKEVLVD